MDAATRRVEAESARWVCFGLGGQDYGLPIVQVQEVLRLPPIEAVPGCIDIVPGVINLRGQVVTVIDLRCHLQLSMTPATADSRIVVVAHDGEPFGLLVDRIGEVTKLAASDIKPVPTLHRHGDRYGFAGVARHGGGLLTLLDVPALMRGIGGVFLSR
ncbi:chemotaxis protein CheW [Solimonas marina]|uniref:Chemotaxis protein CheW n=1 Tax=Solimonas marina TaxID=2714601 RepID=A0A970B5H4_9GAMM|nr:chemotaxis protein CheW [Solimonas marina]NKF21713.1 chemotaxis protein CheW [Solimonas marina]